MYPQIILSGVLIAIEGFMTDFDIYKKCFIEKHKDTKETIKELRLLLLYSECSIAEINDIIEAIIAYRRHS